MSNWEKDCDKQMLNHLEGLSPERMLHELLAVIHGDGGHHTEEVGLAKSVFDAESIHYFKNTNLVSIQELREDIERLKETGHLFNGVQFDYVNVEDLNDLFNCIMSKEETEISVSEVGDLQALKRRVDDNSDVINNVVFDHIQDLQAENADMKERIQKLEAKVGRSDKIGGSELRMPMY